MTKGISGTIIYLHGVCLLRYFYKRYKCCCNLGHPFDEYFSFIRKYERSTILLEKYIFTLFHKNTLQNVCNIAEISHSTYQRIYNYYTNNVIQSIEHSELKLLAIDDIAVRKEHVYNSVVYNLEEGNVVAIIKGRKKTDVIDYFKTLSIEAREKIQAVSMDMSRSYCSSVLECFPNAKPVIDRFHISQALHVRIDEARKHIQNSIRKHEKKDEVFKIRGALLKMSKI